VKKTLIVKIVKNKFKNFRIETYNVSHLILASECCAVMIAN